MFNCIFNLSRTHKTMGICMVAAIDFRQQWTQIRLGVKPIYALTDVSAASVNKNLMSYYKKNATHHKLSFLFYLFYNIYTPRMGIYLQNVCAMHVVYWSMGTGAS